MATFKCRGRKLLDDAGNPLCAHEADRRWLGPCPGCGRYYNVDKIGAEHAAKKVTTLADLATMKVKPRISTGVQEFDEVLNGGLPVGGSVIISGPPGAGKSTVLMTVADNVGRGSTIVTYASGEQGEHGLVEIAHRLKVTENRNVQVLTNEGDIYKITDVVEGNKSKLLVIDSLQTASLDDCKADEGSAEQCKAVVNYLTAWAMREDVSVILVSHVNKDGDLAGPKAVEHLVDGTLELDFCPTIDEDGDIDEATKDYRSLASGTKFRLGPSGVSRMFNMTSEGIKPVRKKTRLYPVK